VRPSFDEIYLEMAHVLRRRSTCKRGKVGVVLVRGSVPIGMGYNGSLPGEPHCIDLDCDVDANVHNSGCTRTIHAEINTLLHCARIGISTDRTTMYCTHSPCKACAKAVVSAGVLRYVYTTPYRDESGLEILYEQGVDVCVA
jgi:dCMP deaminase